MTLVTRLCSAPRPARWPWVASLVMSGCLLIPSAGAVADASLENRIRVLESVPSSSSAQPELALQQVLLLAKQGDAEAAFALLRSVKAAKPDIDIVFYEGLLFYEQGEYLAAQKHFSKALRTNPNSFWSLYYRAHSAAALSDLALAISDYRRLLSLRSDLAPGYYLTLVGWLAESGSEYLSEAIALLDDRMAEVGNLSVLLQRARMLEVEIGNLTAAIDRHALFDSRIRATPEWKIDLAKMLITAGRHGEARAYLAVAREQLYELRPTPARRDTAEELEVLDQLLSAQPAIIAASHGAASLHSPGLGE